MFSVDDRQLVRERILSLGRDDPRISGGAVTGSYAVGAEDRWSDIDTAFGYVDGASPVDILGDWTTTLRREFDVAHHFDLERGATVYRVFLLVNALEVDVSLTPAELFGAQGPAFRMMFGASVDALVSPVESRDGLIGWAWIYLLGASAAIARERYWQALRLVGAARDHGLALACLRYGVASAHAKGVHLLPAEAVSPWRESLATDLEATELRRALAVATRAFLLEIGKTDQSLAAQLTRPLSEIT
jgi:hypothetical protein